MGSLAAWLPALPAVAVAALVIVVPGLIATAPVRLSLIPRVAISSVLGIAGIGLAGVVFGLVGWRFSVWQPLVVGALICALVWPWARRVRRRTGRARVGGAWAGTGWIVASWAIASVVIAVIAFAAVPSPERISQSYDNLFHLAATAHILDTGDASSLTLRTLIETDRTWGYYPAAWHSVLALTVQLTGAPVAVAANAAWIAVCAVVWVPGSTWLAQTALTGYRADRVALIALPLSAGFGAMPYALLTWGTLYPTFLATAVLPVAVGLVVGLLRRHRATGAVEPRPVAVGIVMLAGAVAALAFSQPRVIVTWGVLIAPLVIGAAIRLYRSARRRGGRSRRIAGWTAAGAAVAVVVAAAGAFAYLVLRLGLFDRPLDDRLGGPQARATQSIGEGLWQVLVQSWPLGVEGRVTVPAVILAALVALGIVVAARTRRLRWLVIGYVVFALLFVLAAGSDSVFAKLATALWYKDRYRLSSVLPVLGVVLATLGVLVLARWALRRRPRAIPAAQPALAWIASVTAGVGMLLGGVTASVAFVFRMPETAASSEIVSQAQIAFMDGVVRATVPPGQRLLGDPWDGSALSLLYAGREPVFPHVNGNWDPDRSLVAWHLQDIDTDPAVCVALDALRVRYVLYNPHAFGGGDPSGNHFIGVHTAVQAGLFTPVATDGDSTLYRIDQCGALGAG